MLKINIENLLLTSNQQFCYWLQGYFEISTRPVALTQAKVELMMKNLDLLAEPLGEFTQWLREVCAYCATHNYKPETLAYFLPLIENSLASVFLHVIDNSYITDTPAEIRQNIHDGKIEYDQRRI
jgi:hypothetical protein